MTGFESAAEEPAVDDGVTDGKHPEDRLERARERIRDRGEAVCRAEYREALHRLEAQLGRPLEARERAVLARLARRLGTGLLAVPLHSLSTAADEDVAAVALSLFGDDD